MHEYSGNIDNWNTLWNHSEPDLGINADFHTREKFSQKMRKSILDKYGLVKGYKLVDRSITIAIN